MRPLYNDPDKISDGVFVVYDGPASRFHSNRLGGHAGFNPRGYIANNRQIAPEAKPAFIVRVKTSGAYKEHKRNKSLAIQRNKIKASREKQAIRESRASYADLEPYGA